MDAAIATRGLTKRYGPITAVEAVDLRVDSGDVYGLLGPNGAGKTTFMRMLLGLVEPDGGHVEVFGERVIPGRAGALRETAGFVETPRFYPYLSGRANLEALARLDRGQARAEVDDVLVRVELSDRATSKVREYSYGMVQRLGIAAALMREPRLLILDEPTNGLDPAGIRDMRVLIRDLARTGITILLSSHNMLEVEEICEHVAIVDRGRVAFDGSMDELRELAEDVEYRLSTSDDDRAAEHCREAEGVANVRVEGGAIRFDSQAPHVERLTRRLGSTGIGIRRLELPVTALETLFFRLTEAHAEDAREEAMA